MNHALLSYVSSLRFLFSIFASLDANFRLRRKNVSSEKVDPGICHGYAYNVENVAYTEHLVMHQGEKEPVCIFNSLF